MMVELSDFGGEIDQTAEEDPAGTTLAAACLGGGAAAVLMSSQGYDWSDAPMEPSLKYKTWNHIDNSLG